MSDTSKNEDQISEQRKTEIKTELWLITIFGGLAISVIIYYFGYGLVFLFAGLIATLLGKKELDITDKLPMVACVVAIALVAFKAAAINTTSYSGQTGYPTQSVERVDGLTTGQLNGRNCSLAQLSGGQSMMVCD